MSYSIMENGGIPSPLPLLSLNHISLACKSVKSSTEFYQRVLGFQLVKRPSSLNFEGAWLFNNYGVGIHLLKSESVDNLPQKSEINPRDNHVSFQCSDVNLAEKKLQEMKIKYEKRVVMDGGIYIDQLFFHDPDDYMIEICNCENMPVVPVRRSKSLHITLPKSTSKTNKKESYSEISLVRINATPDQKDFSDIEQEGEGTIEERQSSSEPEELLFLDMMIFCL